MSTRTKNAVTAALILMAATWASSASALVITGKFYLTEDVMATATEPGDTYVGHYSTVDFDNSDSKAGDIVELNDISVANLFGGFSFSDFSVVPLAVLGSQSTVVSFTGDAKAIQTNPQQEAYLWLRHTYGDPSDATFSAVLMNDQAPQMILGHQSVPEPTIFALLGGGLLALGGVFTRRRKQG